MYQIVFTSEFIRSLKDSTGSMGAPGPGVVTIPAAAPEPLSEVAVSPCARTGLAGLGALVFGAATRLLGAH